MIGRRRKNLPKWRYDFNCRKCDNIQFIDDPARRPPGRLLRGVCGSLRPGTAEPDPRRRRPRRPVRLLSADPRT